MRFKFFKYLFYFFLFLTAYSFFATFAAFFFFDPIFNNFEKYKRLYNWDTKIYAVDDFDNDGQKDVISVDGCTFLSSVDVRNIPDNQQCIVTPTIVVFYPNKAKIGQKYIRDGLPIRHSYLAKNENETWKIFVNSGEFAIFGIQKGKLLQKENNIPITFNIDEALYPLSFWGFLLFIPILFLLSSIHAPLYNFFSIIIYLIALLIITLVIYFLWKRNNSGL